MPQPSQKHFESLLWQTLRRFDPKRVVFVESESRTVGRLRVPEPLLERMRAAPCIRLEMPLPARVDLLMADYDHLVRNPSHLAERLQTLREARGAAVVDRWLCTLAAGNLPAVVEELLSDHYDPIYLRSMARNFALFDQARVIDLADSSPESLREAAARLISTAEPRID